MNAVKVLELLGVYLYDLMAKRADEVRKNAVADPYMGSTTTLSGLIAGSPTNSASALMYGDVRSATSKGPASVLACWNISCSTLSRNSRGQVPPSAPLTMRPPYSQDRSLEVMTTPAQRLGVMCAVPANDRRRTGRRGDLNRKAVGGNGAGHLAGKLLRPVTRVKPDVDGPTGIWSRICPQKAKGVCHANHVLRVESLVKARVPAVVSKADDGGRSFQGCFALLPPRRHCPPGTRRIDNIPKSAE